MSKILTYKTAFIALISLFLIFLPDQTYGKMLPVVDIFMKKITALSEWGGPFASFFIYSFLYFAIGYIVLLVAVWLLNGIIAATPVALTVIGGDTARIIEVGWNFSVGIVNLLLIIAFIVIAFAVILGSEKIQLKKALPKLIVVALLVNFTLLFVGAGIDISNFLFNTIALQMMTGEGGGNVISSALDPLINFGLITIIRTMVMVAITAGLLVIPFVSIGVQLSWPLMLPVTLPLSAQFLIYGAIMWALAGLFFIYFVVFLARIFIVQVLAILAPLAFFCLIFDSTKKWWDKWIDALIQWLLVGVIFIFLMYVGIGLAPLVGTLAIWVAPGGFIGWFARDFVAHIALLVYFTVIIGVAKSFVPAAANALISQAQGVIQSLAPIAGAIAVGTGRRIRNAELARTERMRNAPPPPPEGAGLWAKAKYLASAAPSQIASGAVRWGHRAAGVGVEQQVARDQKEKADELEKFYGDDHEAATRDFNWRFSSETDQVGYAQYLSTKGAEALKKLEKENFKEFEKIIDLLEKRGDQRLLLEINKHRPDLSDTITREKELSGAIALPASDPDREKKIKEARKNLALARKMQNALSRTIKKDADVQKLEGDLETLLEELKTTTNPALRAAKRAQITAKIKEIREARVATTYRSSARSVKTQDIENLHSSTLKNPRFLMEILKNRDLSFIDSIAKRSDGADIMKELVNLTETIAGDPTKIAELKKANPSICNQIKRSVGGRAMFPRLSAAL